MDMTSTEADDAKDCSILNDTTPEVACDMPLKWSPSRTFARSISTPCLIESILNDTSNFCVDQTSAQ